MKHFALATPEAYYASLLVPWSCDPWRGIAVRPSPALAQRSKGCARGFDPFGEQLPLNSLLRIGSTRLRPGQTVKAMAFTADKSQLVAINSDSGAFVWDIATGKLTRAFGHSLYLLPTAVSADASLAAIVESVEACRVYDTATGREINIIRASWINTTALCFSPDKKCLASLDNDGVVRIWNVANGALRRRLVTDNGPHFTVSEHHLVFSPDSTILAIGSRTAHIALWNAATGQSQPGELMGKPGTGYHSLAFSPDGKIMAAVEWQGQHFCLWDTASGKQLLKVASGDDKDSFRCLALTPDGKSVATRHNGEIRVWDIATGQRQRAFAVREGAAGLAISNDGRRLATSGSDCSLFIQEMAAGKDQQTLGAYLLPRSKVRLSPDGKALLSLSDPSGGWSELRIWDAQGGNFLRKST